MIIRLPLKALKIRTTQIRKLVNKKSKQITRIRKQYFRRAFILSMSLRLVLVALPAIAVPAMAQYQTSDNPLVNADFVLAKSASVISLPVSQVQIVPGDSNATVTARTKAQKQAAIIKAASASNQQTISAVQPSLADLRALYNAAGAQYAVPPQLLEAIHQVESGKSGDTAKSSPSGAIGPFQFMTGTWRTYGAGGSITSVHDGAFAAARLLRANYDGSGGSWDAAILSYNHSQSYLRMVKNMVKELGVNL